MEIFWHSYIGGGKIFRKNMHIFVIIQHNITYWLEITQLQFFFSTYSKNLAAYNEKLFFLF